jgi:lipopolysaccharide transport system ATP-binding protein
MTADCHIHLEHVFVEGVDTQARASTLRQWMVRKQNIRPIPIPILKDVTLHLKPGDKLGIVGMNGSGKSSLLKVVSGNYPPKSGIVDVRGTIAPLIEMGAGFDPDLSGRNNIKLSFAYRGRLRQYTEALAQQIVEFSELGDKIDLPLKTYSSGMSSRLAFSSAIFQDPDILLLDEVLAAGDLGFVEKSGKAIVEKLDQAHIAIIVSHGIGDLKNLCNRFILMHKGEIIMEDTADNVFKKYQHDILSKTSAGAN